MVHTVAADVRAGYSTTISGECGADGSVTPEAGDGMECTITADDDPPPQQLSVGDVTRAEGNAGTTAFTFTSRCPQMLQRRACALFDRR